MEIRKLKTADYLSYVRIVKNTYPGFKITEDDKFVARLKKMNKNKAIHFYGCFMANELVGGMILYDFELNYLGSRDLCGGVGLVATDFLHKKQGIARKMLESFIANYNNRGANWTSLYPFRADFYKKMGFGFGPRMDLYTVEPKEFKKYKKEINIKYLTPEDSTYLSELYNLKASETHGYFYREEGFYQNMLPVVESRIVGFFQEEKLTGYLVFDFVENSDFPDNMIKKDLRIKELIYRDSETLQSILSFFSLHEDQVVKIKLFTQDKDFYHLLPNPTDGKNEDFLPVGYSSGSSGIGIMYKCHNIRRFFETKGRLFTSDTEAKFKLIIKDTFTNDNSGELSLVLDKTGFKIKDHHLENTLSIDIETLSSILIGALKVEKAIKLGLGKFQGDTEVLASLKKSLAIIPEPNCVSSF